jgi:hypothetical protein
MNMDLPMRSVLILIGFFRNAFAFIGLLLGQMMWSANTAWLSESFESGKDRLGPVGARSTGFYSLLNLLENRSGSDYFCNQ